MENPSPQQPHDPATPQKPLPIGDPPAPQRLH